MILTLLAVVYITLLCRIFGLWLIPPLHARRLSFLMPSFVGLALIGICSTAASIFVPLQGWIPQVILAGAAVTLLIMRPMIRAELLRVQLFPGVIKAVHDQDNYLHPLIILLGTGILLTLLLMSTYPVAHPDTLIYHAQNIQWVSEFPAVRGIANADYHYGLQSSWFVLSALFRLDPLHSTPIGFAGITVVCWTIGLILLQLNKFNQYFVPWFLLLVLTGWSYTQARLTVTSASPDFIATIFCWLAFYVFATRSDMSRRLYQSLLILFISTAISLKLSVLPIGLLIVADVFRQRANAATVARIRTALVSFLLILLCTAPMLTRNVIASGYALFPSGVGGVRVPWAVPDSLIDLNADYIRAYARGKVDYNEAEIRIRAKDSVSQWMPAWWSGMAVADKALIVFTELLFFACLLRRRKIDRRSWNVFGLIFLTGVAGSVWWLVLAPDPRFGYGFILPVTAVLLISFIRTIAFFPRRRFLLLSIGLASAVVLAYGGYRVINFFKPSQLLQPAGLTTTTVRNIPCKGGCEPLGPSVDDGFRAK